MALMYESVTAPSADAFWGKRCFANNDICSDSLVYSFPKSVWVLKILSGAGRPGVVINENGQDKKRHSFRPTLNGILSLSLSLAY